MDRLVDLNMEADFISKAALQKIKQTGITRQQVGLVFDGAPITGSNDERWPIEIDGTIIGQVNSAVYSPRLKANIALAMVSTDHSAIGTKAVIKTTLGDRGCEIVPKPFYDPNKAIAAKS